MKPTLKFLDSAMEKMRDSIDGVTRENERLKEELKGVRCELAEVQAVASRAMEEKAELIAKFAGLDEHFRRMKDVQAQISKQVEEQNQYGRKTTLLLSGRAVPSPQEGENTRTLAVGLIRHHLGLQVQPGGVVACHRLKNRSVILVRFAYLEERMEVYRRRTKPAHHGLLVHESLTPERLEVVKTLKQLHTPRDRSPFVSYYTNTGRIYIRITANSRPVELFVGTTRAKILQICGQGGDRHHTGDRADPRSSAGASLPVAGLSRGVSSAVRGSASGVRCGASVPRAAQSAGSSVDGTTSGGVSSGPRDSPRADGGSSVVPGCPRSAGSDSSCLPAAAVSGGTPIAPVSHVVADASPRGARVDGADSLTMVPGGCSSDGGLAGGRGAADDRPGSAAMRLDSRPVVCGAPPSSGGPVPGGEGTDILDGSPEAREARPVPALLDCRRVAGRAQPQDPAACGGPPPLHMPPPGFPLGVAVGGRPASPMTTTGTTDRV